MTSQIRPTFSSLLCRVIAAGQLPTVLHPAHCHGRSSRTKVSLREDVYARPRTAELITASGMPVGPIGMLIVLIGMVIAGGVTSLVAMLRGQRTHVYFPGSTSGFIGHVGFVSEQ